MNIGVDVDGTLFDVVTPLLDKYNEKHGTNHKSEDITDYKLHKCLNIDYNEFYSLLSDIWLYEWEKIKPYDLFTDNCLNSLRPENKIIIVTKRDIITVPSVIYALKKWRIKVDGIICINNGLDKCIVNIDVLLDDSKEVLDNFAGTGVLIKRPYNPVYDVENIKEFCDRVKSGEITKQGIKLINKL